MKKIILIVLTIVIAFGLIGCSSVEVNPLDKNVAVSKDYVNHYTKPYLEITTSEDIEDVVVYLPKDTTTLRLKMKVSNLEDIIYMKLVTEDGFEIDKIVRRVSEMKELGYEQDGYMYEPSVEKNIVTIQIYVPSVYIYNGTYTPKLIFSFKRNSRSLQESVQLNFARHIYSVSSDNNATQERPNYTSLSDYCAASKKAGADFFKQVVTINENRIDLETIKEIENSCR